MVNLTTFDFHRSPYRLIWKEQKELFDLLVEYKREGRPVDTEYLLLGEHDPVYTLGFHGKAANMLYSEERLKALGAECIRIERGGDITYHGPGQMIAYPIVDLENHGIGIKGYINLLEDCIIALLEDYGIRGETIDDAIGIWVDKGKPGERKICAIGVKCTRFVTMHGLALNVNTDLSAFSAINPCGFVDKGVTSIEREIGHKVDIEEVKVRFDAIFRRLFQLPPQPHTPFQEMS